MYVDVYLFSTFYDGDKTMSPQHSANFKRNFYDRVYQDYPTMAAWARQSGFKSYQVYMLLDSPCQSGRGEARKIKQAIEQIIDSPMPSGKKRHKK
ncbi:MAG: hypothetical protein ACR5LG_10225 [Sodalis sp. (in: enterobacteria)]|uniref:hypothetical protein n=1 Tax=Sodalis sp. (in: enterobacteria) TaxID=1898979 RepID=UPI003F3E5817